MKTIHVVFGCRFASSPVSDGQAFEIERLLKAKGIKCDIQEAKAPSLQRAQDFTLCDRVVWDETAFPTQLPAMVQSYGQGPFEVVGLRLHTAEARANGNGYPTAVTIELPGGHWQEFTGAWFKKVP